MKEPIANCPRDLDGEYKRDDDRSDGESGLIRDACREKRSKERQRNLALACRRREDEGKDEARVE